MTVELLTIQGGLLALAVLVPLVAFVGVSRRAARTRAVLGLPEPAPRQRLLSLVALLAVAGLLGLAAMQPVLERSTTNTVRRDAEVFMVVDISRSMLARQSPGAPSRLDRAKVVGARLRAALPDAPVGIASMTNRVLPHLFPSGDADVFRATLERAIGIERPPPGSSFLTPQQEALRQATTFASLAGVATRRFFSPDAKQRLLVVLTDGETTRVSEAEVGRRLRGARIETVFLHVWSASERVFTKGVPERRYAPDPAARSNLESLAFATGGSVYDETTVGSAAGKARELLGNGPTVAQGLRPDRVALAPYLALAAAFPLTLLLWRRDR